MTQPITIVFTGDDSGLTEVTEDINKQFDDLQKDLNGLGGKSNKASRSFGADMKSMAAKAAIAAAAIAAVGKVVIDMTEDVIEASEKQPELFTTEQLAEVKELSTSVDALKDSFTRMKIAIVSEAAPAMTGFIDSIVEGTDKNRLYKERFEELTEGFKFGTVTIKERAAAELYAQGISRELSSEIDSATRSYIDQGIAIHGTILALSEQEIVALTVLDAGMKMTEMTASYDAKTLSLNEQLEAELVVLSNVYQKYGAGSVQLETQTKKVSGLQGQISGLDTTMELQTDKWILGLMAQNDASTDAQIAYAEYAGLITEESANQARAVLDASESLDNLGSNYDNFGEAIRSAFENANEPIGEQDELVGSINEGLFELNGMEARATIIIDLEGDGASLIEGITTTTTTTTGGSGDDDLLKKLEKPKYATGGSFMVGGFGGTDSQLVQFRASPNERVDIKTPAQQAAGDGNMTMMIAAIASSIPSARDNAKALARELQKVM